jgi:hypothetical protein
MTLSRSVALTILLSLPAHAAWAQKTVATPASTTKMTVTIQQIDATKRLVTFRAEDGTEDTVWASPKFKRFDELKVGDRVNLTYYESKVYQVRPAGTAVATTGTEKMAATPGKGALPAGTVARQTIQSVTVKAIDPAVPSITVTTTDGRTITRKVEKKASLTGIKAGDTIDITTSEALLASVERAK